MDANLGDAGQCCISTQLEDGLSGDVAAEGGQSTYGGRGASAAQT